MPRTLQTRAPIPRFESSGQSGIVATRPRSKRSSRPWRARDAIDARLRRAPRRVRTATSRRHRRGARAHRAARLRLEVDRRGPVRQRRKNGPRAALRARGRGRAFSAETVRRQRAQGLLAHGSGDRALRMGRHERARPPDRERLRLRLDVRLGQITERRADAASFDSGRARAARSRSSGTARS